MLIESEQSKEMGPECFARLQEKIAAAPAEDLEAFLAAWDPDIMGPAGREGIDAD